MRESQHGRISFGRRIVGLAAMAVNDAEIAPQALSISTQCVIVSAAVFQAERRISR
jgi:hypothetical protein